MSRGDSNVYPIPGLQTDPDFNGISIREHFAAMAMQGLLANPDTQLMSMKLPDIAVLSRDAADALIAELAKAKP